MTGRIVIIILCGLLVLGAAKGLIAVTENGSPPLVPGVDYVQGEVIITLNAAHMPSKERVQLSAGRLGVEALDRTLSVYKPLELEKLIPSYNRYNHPAAKRLERTFVFRYADGTDAREVIKRLSSHPAVEQVSLNHLAKFELQGVPRFEPDPSTAFSTQWNLDNTNDMLDIDAPEAWAIEKGNPDLIIGIFDEGTQLNHCGGGNWILNSDLNYYFNAGEDLGLEGPDNGDLNDFDDDGDGWVDNVVGISADRRCEDPIFGGISLENVPFDWKIFGLEPLCDFYGVGIGHGIAVAGVAAGQHEGTDVAGISPNCQVHFARFSFYGRGSISAMASAIIYLAEIADVVNMSFTNNTGGPFPTLDAAFTAGANDPLLDCLFIAATGNSGESGQPVGYPANHPDVMAVGSMTDQALLWYKSQWTPGIEEVDVVAPVGEGIPLNKHTESYCPGEIPGCDPCQVVPLSTEIVANGQGTSYAAPQASGIAALIRSRFPALNQAEVRARIKNSAEYYWDNDPQGPYKYGAGKVNAYLALTEFGSIDESTTWGSVEGMPDTLIVSGDLVVEPGVTLTINPGTTVLVACEDAKPNETDGIDADRVEIIVKGSIVIGTQGSGPIVFESYSDAPEAGDWYGIRYLSGATSSPLAGVTIKHAYIGVRSEIAVTMNNCTVSDGDLGVWSDGGAAITGGSFSDLNNIAIQVHSGNATVDDVTIEDCNGGIDFSTPQGETAALSLSNSLIGGATNTGVQVTTTGNGQNTFDLYGVTVSNGSNSGIIVLSSGSSGSIDSCFVTGNGTGLVLNSANSITVTDCSIESNTTYGILSLLGSGHVIAGNAITGSNYGISFMATQNVELESNVISNNSVGVFALSEASPDLGGGSAGSSGNNSLTNNSLYHVQNLNSSTTVMAEDNWWGSSTGPDPAKILGSVDYDPWLTGAPSPSPPALGTGDVSEGGRTPVVHALVGAYPNPFNPSTTISYTVAEPGCDVHIAIYNSNGSLVKVVVDDFVASGAHTAMWDGSNNVGAPSASGVYFVRMTAGDFRNTKKVVLVK